MTHAGATLKFDLSKVRESGVRAILEGLRIDRDNVLRADFDPATGMLEVAPARPDAAGHLESFVASMGKTHRLISRKVIHENRVAYLAIQDIDAALVASSEVQVLAAGLTGLNGSLLALFRFFEREFRRLAAEFHAEENQYPVMIPANILEEVGYFAHFPQHVTFCSHLPDNLPVLESVASQAGHGAEPSGHFADAFDDVLAKPRHMLVPGVCLPCYRQQRDVVMQDGEIRTLTMQNHVFRYEGANFRPLTRGWDFTVRDIVFFGGRDDMSRLRSEVMERTMTFCRELELEVTIELANDPFFLDASRDKAIYQRMGEVKYELLFSLPYRGESLAASSFNLHRDFYTAVYNTRLTNGSLAESACMGFGMERWLYGFLSQKGLSPSGWPARVTSNL
jgi:seryl-tRNA synthetase